MRLLDLDPHHIRFEINHETGWLMLKLIEQALLEGDLDLKQRDYGELLAGALELALSTVRASSDLVQAQYELEQLKRAWDACQDRSRSSTTTNGRETVPLLGE